MQLTFSASKPMTMAQTTPRLIGILGGMGPAATIDLQQKILAATSAQCDQDHAPTLVWNVPQMPDRLAAIRGEGPSPLPQLIHAARILEQAGANVIAMPCNTAHYWADDLAAALTIPLLHIADAVLDDLPESTRRIALLSTPATVQAGFYQRRFDSRGIETLLPSATEAGQLMAAIGAVKAGRMDEARAPFLAVASALRAHGADTLLLACTELPLISPGTAIEAQCVDPTAALARACIRHAFTAPTSRSATDREHPRGVELA
jgi:aspartate racemase